ncbi:MAG TPA: ABC transporter ATP-binding protein [Acidimicrobiales bacterium]|nr:ABC transporter ATP-binding protein [Acidimicrobiales bacterium]
MADHVELEQVCKVFPNGTTALADVSLEAPAGKFLVLLGPSGSGKTTLLRLVAGIERLTSGRIAVSGNLVADGRMHLPPERRGLSMVFQDYALWPHLSVLENVAFALRRRGGPKDERREQASRMLERVGLTALAGRYPGQLSGGEQQRVALARALVGDVGLVLFDEPLSNLDADLRERMRLEISTLVRESGATAIYITHDQSEAFALADRIGVLEKGRLVQLSNPEDVYAHPATPFVARFTGAATELRVRLRHAAAAGDVVMVDALLADALPVSARAIEAVEGGEALLLVRPASVRICGPSEDSRHAVGSVTDVAFRGRGYELAVDLSTGQRVSNVVAGRRVQRGEVVGLHFEESGCVVFPEPPAAAEQRQAAEEVATHPEGGAPAVLTPPSAALAGRPL